MNEKEILEREMAAKINAEVTKNDDILGENIDMRIVMESKTKVLLKDQAKNDIKDSTIE